MLTGIAHDVDARQVGHGGEHRVRTVQQRHLTLVVRGLVVGQHDVQPGLFSRELTRQLLQRQVGRRLDDPQVEGLALHHHIVLVAQLLLYLLYILAGEARHNAVDQRGTYVARLCGPPLKGLIVSAEVVAPKFHILVDALAQVVSVEEDEFARHDDKALLGVALEGLEPVPEQLHQFTRITAGGSVDEPARRVEGNTGLRGVRDDESHLGLFGQPQESVEVLIGIQGATDGVHQRQRIDRLSVE